MEEKNKIDIFLQSLWKFCNTENLAQKRTNPKGSVLLVFGNYTIAAVMMAIL